MNIHRPEHLDAQYIYREYNGYIFKLPRNKELGYQSIETQEYYYWTLTELAYKQLILGTAHSVAPSIWTTQVAGWEISTNPVDPCANTTSQTQSVSRYIQLNDIKKSQRDKLISAALARVFTTTLGANPNNPFQFIETTVDTLL